MKVRIDVGAGSEGKNFLTCFLGEQLNGVGRKLLGARLLNGY